MQNATTILEACIFATVLCGFFGIILKKNPIVKIISMDAIGTGVIAHYVLVASRGGLFTPTVCDTRFGGLRRSGSPDRYLNRDRDRVFDPSLLVGAMK